MKIETTFSCGDKAWVFSGEQSIQMTIGQVRIEHTNSTSTPGMELFSNYQGQKGHKEQYMCKESGIGSGSIYTLGESIFKTKAACDKHNAKRLKELAEYKEKCRKEEIRDALCQAEHYRLRAEDLAKEQS